MSGDKKGSGLDIFDSLAKKKESPLASDSGVVVRGGGSKAPPPPPSVSRPGGMGAPMPPPSLASLAAPVAKPSVAPPPPSSLRATPPPPSASYAPAPPNANFAPPPPSQAPQPKQSFPPTPPVPPASAAPPRSAPAPSHRSMPPPSIPRPPGTPNGALRSYGGDGEDDAPTRLYAHGSTPPPPQSQRTMPRNERPMAPSMQTNPGLSMRRESSKKKLYVVSGVVGMLVAALALLLGNRTGALTVTVTGPGGRAVDGIQVFVDGVKKCDTSPCRVDELASGAHLVRASAKGYQDTADQAVSVEAGQQSTQNVSLAPAGLGTGVRVSALGSGLMLYVDGQEIGELPESAKNLTPGDHALKVAGNDRYEPWEERVTLDDGEMKSIGPLKLKVLKGLATFKAGPGADGARVLLDGRLVPELPATIEVPAGKQLNLVATKSGYSTYKRTVGFDDGVAEKSFEITMVEGNDDGAAGNVAAPVAAASPQPKSASVASHASSASFPAVSHPSASTGASSAKGKATLNMNSIPVSNVILNGRPLGQTPKVGIQVAPGPQTVVFIHPTLGRKVMSATVNAGETKTFMAKLQ